MNFTKTASLRFLTGIFAALGSLLLFSCEKVVEHQVERFEQDMDISVPAAETTDRSPQVGEIVISVNKDGEITIAKKSLTLVELKQRLTKISKEFPDQAVVLRGHQETDFQKIIDVLDEVKAAGIWNVAFAARKP